ncbi:MAG TPA: universal stress protein [Planctomycetota bacterium]|jgi:nucleotide-binding universal stress UspA family protein|nr:universal stress protein [Planctomycetota bacterium]
MSRHLLLLDGSTAAEEAIPHAVEAARTFRAKLLLLHVLAAESASPQGAVDSVAWRMRRAEAGAYLKAWQTRLEEQDLEVETEVREGRPDEQILDVVRSRAIDLLVFAPRGAGAGTTLGLGDTAQKIVSSGAVSFLLVRAPLAPHPTKAGAPRYRRVLVPLDASRRAECAIQVAAAIARAHDAPLCLEHVAPVPELPGAMPPTVEDVELRDRVVARNRQRGSAYLEEVRGRVAGGDLDVTTKVLVAPDVGRAVCRSVRDEQVDLVVASAHGGGCRGTGAFPPYGNVARELITDGVVSVWVLQDLPTVAGADASPASGPQFSSPVRETETVTPS